MAAGDPLPPDVLIFGCDVGGTKLHSVLATHTGEIVAETREQTAPEGGDAVLDQIARHLAELSAGRRVMAAGVGLPGAVHPLTHQLTDAPHLAGLAGRDLLAVFTRCLAMPVALGNDVTLAALGEAWLGEAKGARSFAFLALGTGVGIGLVEGGRPLIGARGGAGEIADLPLPAPGGGIARLEDLVSTRALLADYRARGGKTPGNLRDIFAVGQDDAELAAMLDQLVQRIAIALRAVVALTDPERIVLGGGLGSRAEVVSRLQAIPNLPPVCQSALGTRAGVLGAIFAAKRMVAP